ncbi:MAG: cyclase family protein, partial [Bacteroidota bacterium]
MKLQRRTFGGVQLCHGAAFPSKIFSKIKLARPANFPLLAAMNITASITHQGKFYQADLSHPLDISIPIAEGLNQVNCFYAPPVEFSPVVAGSFIGSTAQGGLVNFFNVKINPHGNGTHTECVGHIAKEKFTIRQCLTSFHFLAKLVSLYPTRLANGDRVFLREQFEEVLKPGEAEAFILRTLPNDEGKLHRNYSGSNPPYIDEAAAEYLATCGVEHFLLDLPSVDREEDGGKLLAHRAFWQYFQGSEQPERHAENQVRKFATITELIFVSGFIKDGLY